MVLAPVNEFLVPNGIADTVLAQMFISDDDEALEFMGNLTVVVTVFLRLTFALTSHSPLLNRRLV